MNIQHNIALKNYNTMGLAVFAKYFYSFTDNAQLIDLLKEIKKYPQTYFLGGGSNTVFLHDFDGLVVHLATRGIEYKKTENNQVLVTAQAGENWHNFVQYTVQQGWFGLENLSLIYGTVGASPIQNIGAYGVEVKDRIRRVFATDTQTGKSLILHNHECNFAYRNSIFRQPENKNLLISAVEFQLDTAFQPQLGYGDIAATAEKMANGKPITAQIVANAVIQTRQAKLPNPDELGNAGSFFRNPIVSNAQAIELKQQYSDMPIFAVDDKTSKLSAAKLIDLAGLKGFALGGAAVYHKQPLVLVNQNNATPQDIVDLCQYIQKVVQEKFAVSIQPEPVFVG